MWIRPRAQWPRVRRRRLATALYFDLVPDDQRPQLLAALVRTLEENGYRQTTGEVCFRMLVQTLADAGRSDVVYRMLQRDDPPGYGYMLKLGFKTLSETWNGPGSSMNHCMFGHAREWFQKSVLGIQQAPGVGRIPEDSVDSRTGRRI